MLRLRTTCLILVAVSATSLVAVSVSSGSAEFTPSTKQKFTSTSGSGTLTLLGESITCSKDTSAGEVTSAATVGRVVGTFTGCKAKKGEEECAINSAGAKEGEIVTKTLKGELGEVAASEAATRVGLLFEPETGSEVVKLAKVICSSEAAISGSIAGGASPTNSSQTTSKVIFGTTSKHQAIRHLTVKGVSRSPSLEAFGLAAIEETTEALLFEKAVELQGIVALTVTSGPIEFPKGITTREVTLSNVGNTEVTFKNGTTGAPGEISTNKANFTLHEIAANKCGATLAVGFSCAVSITSSKEGESGEYKLEWGRTAISQTTTRELKS
jgi:hypothetical protein